MMKVQKDRLAGSMPLKEKTIIFFSINMFETINKNYFIF